MAREKLILRCGFSCTRGWDARGLLDEGPAFVCFGRRHRDGFKAVPLRLAGESLDEYIRAEGGGHFFALPGVNRSGGFSGEALTAA